MQRIKTLIGLSLLFITPLAMTLGTPVLVAADTPQQEICSGIGLVSGGGCGDGGIQVNHVVSVVVNLLSVVIGIIAVVMIIIAGLRFVTSGGDSGKVTSAKNTIIYALIGLVVVVFAQVVVRFVLANAR